MAAAAIVITPCSTLSIDAACVGTPVINVFFDGSEPVDPALSARRFIRYTHYAKILETGGIGMANDIDEFTSLAKTYIDDRGHHRAGRDAIIRQQLNCLDGKAGERTAETLLQLAGAERSSATSAGGHEGESDLFRRKHSIRSDFAGHT